MSNKFKIVGNTISVKGRGGRVFIASSANQLQPQGFKEVSEIVYNLSQNDGQLFAGRRNGYHSILSVVGNGRWRDRGVSSDLLLTLLRNKKVTKNLSVGYKICDEGIEPVIDTQSLQKILTEVKNNITVDGNGLTATLNYEGTKVLIDAGQYARIKNYL